MPDVGVVGTAQKSGKKYFFALFSFCSDCPEVSEGLFSETSAVTREEVKQVEPEMEEQSNVVMMLADVGNTVSGLVSTLQQVQRHRNTQLLEQHNTM